MYCSSFRLDMFGLSLVFSYPIDNDDPGISLNAYDFLSSADRRYILGKPKILDLSGAI